MKSLHLFIILILLILVVYYHNKSVVYEKVEHFDDNLINQIASIVNGNEITLNNVKINGTLTCNGDVNVSDNKTLSAKNLKTFNIESNYNNWVDIKPQVHMYNTALVDKTFTAPNITTRYLSSTKENGDYINFKCGLFNPNDNKLGTITSGDEGSGRTKIYVNNDLVVNDNNTLRSKNITTRLLNSTDGNNNYINFNCGLYSPKTTIIGCKSNKSNSSNFLLELDNNSGNRQPVSIYTSGHLAIP